MGEAGGCQGMRSYPAASGRHCMGAGLRRGVGIQEWGEPLVIQARSFFTNQWLAVSC